MNNRCLAVIVLAIILLECCTVNGAQSHSLVKRQFPPRPGGTIPLSRRRQFPPPEELEESEEYENSESEEDRGPVRGFRGRQPPEDEYTDDYTYTEAPKVTTPVPPKPTARTIVFNNRFAGRPRFGSQSSTVRSSTSTSKPSTASTSISRSRATPAQSQRLDVVAGILNRPPPPRPSSSRSISNSRTANENEEKKPEISTEAPARRNANSQRVRTRGRLRQRTSSTTTTTTTTTTTKKPEEDYYYYYEDAEEAPENQPIATTTSTTTTTTTTTPRPRPSFSRPRPVGTRNRQTSKPVIKFDPESQFAPPPDDVPVILAETSSTKRFTTSSTMSPAESGGIPPHLRNKYRPRTDGRFIDFLRDPNRPRELKGFDLTDYPFYVKVPEDIDFECEDRKDGYYASIPHKCQLFHYCFAGARYDFLCANYTLYDQTTFTCRFANNVDCESSAKYYYRNDDLWKETTTQAPETTTKRRRKSTPKEEDYDDDDYYYDDEEEDEVVERRRRPPKRRRNRRKNKRNQSDE